MISKKYPSNLKIPLTQNTINNFAWLSNQKKSFFFSVENSKVWQFDVVIKPMLDSILHITMFNVIYSFANNFEQQYMFVFHQIVS